ncbi:isoprenylcysteine carboxylmethyltransferase family protein [Photobacterium sp. OFAV2-7]|uniref:methyltransferase family protein n=1 Tax=Photobacterium sp. OFAV2-7 TaxID=2917748 RepID=UPI001EF594F9|nr:isoprenylcysteine carboxylmethyltransferase family protein [Photobacterium sp. OFAV2-7]MCG7588580.1 isoprenylcysteine carboxylmethyltransferase family protein [Photobacterium sp. OFAV2-7]
MRKLELIIPPVVLMGIFAIGMWLLSVQLPKQALFANGSTLAAATIAMIGVIIALSGVQAFRKASTTVNPLEPQEASTLVNTGVYRITRNPMYLGFLLILVGFGVLLQSVYSLALCLGFILYMNRFQIEPEERFLEAQFSNEFVQYKKEVRRWI